MCDGPSETDQREEGTEGIRKIEVDLRDTPNLEKYLPHHLGTVISTRDLAAECAGQPSPGLTFTPST